ncbi:MAG TPA: hypothetical protein VNN22_04180 [Verrucomicrobiae bacterium]|nr:hypothetical protein [Verrucomicrobiae bacterium]
MNQELNNLVQSLRDEFQQYVEMLVRLDRHHQSVADPSESEVHAFSREVQIQGEAIQRARRERNQACQNLAVLLNLNAVVPVEILIPLIPENYQPLVNELTRENHQLMEQVVESLQRKRSCIRNCPI